MSTISEDGQRRHVPGRYERAYWLGWMLARMQEAPTFSAAIDRLYAAWKKDGFGYDLDETQLDIHESFRHSPVYGATLIETARRFGLTTQGKVPVPVVVQLNQLMVMRSSVEVTGQPPSPASQPPDELRYGGTGGELVIDVTPAVAHIVATFEGETLAESVYAAKRFQFAEWADLEDAAADVARELVRRLRKDYEDTVHPTRRNAAARAAWERDFQNIAYLLTGRAAGEISARTLTRRCALLGIDPPRQKPRQKRR